ncbi:hypothetical protein LSAT2_014709, partial [Lamellibrachia satsuma]
MLLRGLCIDIQNKLMFVRTNTDIYKVGMDGSELVKMTSVSLLHDMAVYPRKREICWTKRGSGVVDCVNYDRRNFGRKHTTMGPPFYLDIDEDVFYWTQTNPTNLVAAYANGTVIRTIQLLNNLGDVYAVAVVQGECSGCSPRLVGDAIWPLHHETRLLFEVKSCSRVLVRLTNDTNALLYLLEFASSSTESNNITVGATGQTSSSQSPFTQDCNDLRQLWVSWAAGVISGGAGLNPGLNEVMRLPHKRDVGHKGITGAKMLTQPSDDSANFTIYRVSEQFVLNPPVTTEMSVRLNDANNETCLALTDADYYSFDAGASYWTPEPQTQCWLPGLIIKRCVPDRIKTSFTVAITGHRLICSTSYFQVTVQQTTLPDCDIAGRYIDCEWGVAVESGALTTCVA